MSYLYKYVSSRIWKRRSESVQVLLAFSCRGTQRVSLSKSLENKVARPYKGRSSCGASAIKCIHFHVDVLCWIPCAICWSESSGVVRVYKVFCAKNKREPIKRLKRGKSERNAEAQTSSQRRRIRRRWRSSTMQFDVDDAGADVVLMRALFGMIDTWRIFRNAIPVVFSRALLPITTFTLRYLQL